MPKPDFYVLGSSTKGVSLNDPEWLNIFNLHGHEHVAKMSPAVAWTDEGWTRRCVDVRAKAIAALPFVVHKGDMTNVVWKAGEEAPEEAAPEAAFECPECGAPFVIEKVKDGRQTLQCREKGCTFEKQSEL